MPPRRTHKSTSHRAGSCLAVFPRQPVPVHPENPAKHILTNITTESKRGCQRCKLRKIKVHTAPFCYLVYTNLTCSVMKSIQLVGTAQSMEYLATSRILATLPLNRQPLQHSPDKAPIQIQMPLQLPLPRTLSSQCTSNPWT